MVRVSMNGGWCNFGCTMPYEASIWDCCILERQSILLHHIASAKCITKCADLTSVYSSDSSDSGTDDMHDTAFVQSPPAIKIPKPRSSRLSRIMRQMEDSGVWCLYLFSDQHWWFHYLPKFNSFAPSLQFLNSMIFSLLFSWLVYLLPNSDQQKAWHLKSQIDNTFLHLLCAVQAGAH